MSQPSEGVSGSAQNPDRDVGRRDHRIRALLPPRRNLSAGGLRLEHTIPLPVGTVVNLTFTLPGDKTPIAISGEIRLRRGPG